MADSFKLVGTYTLDTGGFDAAKEEIKAGYAEIEKGATAAKTATTGLSGTTGSLTDKVAALAVEEKRAAQSAQELAKAQADAASSSKELTTEVGKSQGILSKIGNGFRQFGLGARDGFRTAIKEVGGFRGILSQTGANITNFGKSTVGAFKSVGSFATNALQSVGKGVISATSGIPVIGQLAAALGPVGIAAAAVAGGIYKVVANTDAGATALDGLGRTGGLVFDRITGVAKSFFNELTNGTGIIGTAFDFLSGVVDVFINKLTPIGDIFRALSETSLFQGLKEDFEEGQRLANVFDDLDEKQRNSIGTVAALDAQYRQLNVQLRDRTKTDAERLAIADKLAQVETERAKIELDNLKAVTDAEQQVVDSKRKRNEADDGSLRKLEEAKAAESAASAASVERLEKAENRKNAILEAADQKRQAARQKAIAAREKAEAEQAKKAEQRAQAEAKINETISELARESFERTLTGAEQEVEAVKKKYADLEAVTLEGIAKLRAASPENAQSQITAKEAEAVIAIENAKNEELAALEKTRVEEATKTREEALETIRQSLLTETEAQREAVLTRLDAERELAEQNIEDVVERQAVIAELTRKAEEELTGIVTDEQAKRTELEVAAAAQRQQLAEQNAAIVAGFAEQALQTIITAAASGEDIQEQAGKQLLAILLDTLEKIIIANAFQVQAISAGAPTPDNVATGGIAGIAKGLILAAAVKALFGAAKAALTANYEGDPYIGGDGAMPMWSGRDGFVRRLDYGERVVRRKTNEANFDALEAMEGGTFNNWVRENYMPLLADDDRMVQYVNSDVGQRMAASLVLPRMFDKGIVGAVNSQRKQQQHTNDLLAQLVNNTKPRRTNPRYN